MSKIQNPQIVIEFKYDDDTLKPPERMLMYLPGKSQLTVKGLLALSQAEAREQEIIGKDDRVTRLKYPGRDQHPGGLNISLSTPLSHLETTLVKCQETAADDDILLLSAVVSRAHPGGSETMRMPSARKHGLSKQDVKAEDLPVPASGGTGNIADDITLLSNTDVDQGFLDVPESGSGAETASGGRSSANNGVTPAGSLQAPPQTSKMSTPSLSTAVREGPNRKAAAAITTGTHGDDRSPGDPGRQNLRRPMRRKAALMMKHKEASGDGVRHVSSVVSSAHPEGSDEMRLPLRAEGLSEQEVKAEDSPMPMVDTEDKESSDNAVLLLSDDDGDHGSQEYSRNDCDEEAASGGRSSANRGTPDGSPASPPPPAPAAISSSLSRAVREVIRRAATSTRKREQPEAGEEGGPSYAGREHLKGTAQSKNKGKATATILPLNEESQTRQQKKSTRDAGKAKNRCECGSCHHPSFGLPGTSGRKAARWCSQCPSKPNNAVHVRNKRCECGSCHPTFGLPGASSRKAARWCSQCPSKPHNAVDVVNKRCECGRHRPTYGLPGTSGWKAARWCSLCPSKAHNAVNVVTKRCECGSRQPSFGIPGTSGWKAAQWCLLCPSKAHNAVNVVTKRCECGSRKPSFGLPGVGGMKLTRRWCSQCPSKPSNAVEMKTNKR